MDDEDVCASYKAQNTTGKVEITNTALPKVVSEMIAWIMIHPEKCETIYDEYLRVRPDETPATKDAE